MGTQTPARRMMVLGFAATEYRVKLERNSGRSVVGTLSPRRVGVANELVLKEGS